jgi:hypothetical protein
MQLTRTWGDYEASAPLPDGHIKWGSPEHLTLLSRTLLDTHDPYKPAVIDWPELDEETRGRIVSLPIWDIAVATEGRAGMNVQSYAHRIKDRLLRAAVEMNAFEESRHKVVLSNMVEAYGIGSKELGVEVSFPELARICLAENDRRLSVYDSRLKEPKFVPAMIRLALRLSGKRGQAGAAA